MPAKRLTGCRHAAVLGVFLVLVALYTYPMILHPGRLLPVHKDPMMYGWTMVSNVRRLLSEPLYVFHGNTFYPHGNVVAYTDLLLTPTLTAGPIYLLTGNPVLQYNLTLLIWWALSGWAMYVMTYALLDSHLGATIAALAFTLCPYRTDYFLEFEMELAFPIPLALLFFFRFLDTRRWRDLAGTFLFVWIEALAAMYYAIMLGFALAVVAVLHAILRPRTWNWTIVRRSLVGALALVVALAPFLVPYVQNYREMGMERELGQPGRHSADILTYLETGVTKLYHFSPTRHVAETSLFMGFVALALAAAGSVVPAAWSAGGVSPVKWRISRWLTVGLACAVVGLSVTLVWGDVLRAAGIRPPRAQRFFDALLLLGLVRLGLEGWCAVRAGQGASPLGERELRWIFLFLLVLFFDLSLGPWIRYDGKEFGPGLYRTLYPHLLPLHAMRISTRFGVVVVLAVSFLAGLGIKWLAARLADTTARFAVAGALVALLLAEYASFPLPYQEVDWSRRPPVYQALAEDPEDVAVLEWPLGFEDWEDDYTFMSISHGKRLVNGASGFIPELNHDISATLSAPDTPEQPFPSPGVRRYLFTIYPLRYLVVHNGIIRQTMGADEERKWQRLKEIPWARYKGRFEDDDLYRIVPPPERGVRVERWVSYDFLRLHPILQVALRPLATSGDLEEWVDVLLNERVIRRIRLDREVAATVPLPRPFHFSAPNVTELRYAYARPPWALDARYRIGTTGVVGPGDLRVVSVGQPHGSASSIQLNGVELSPDRRGYNLVALDRAGRVLKADVFDTFFEKDAAHRLAAWVAALPGGTIVAGAVRDEGSGRLTEEAMAALRTLGVAGDLRGHFREAHAFVGVKGAPVGSALEALGPRPIEVTVGKVELVAGRSATRLGFELTEFALKPVAEVSSLGVRATGSR